MAEVEEGINDKGWIVRKSNGVLFSFTYRGTRRESIARFLSVWDNKNWRHFYNRGWRCVKVERCIKILKN